MNNIFYIRHKPTGNFMPVMKGPSYWNPNDAYSRQVPRTFLTKRSAIAALTQWLRGEHKPLRGWDQDGFESPRYQVCLGTEVVPNADRNREDMEIVEYELIEVR